MNLTLPRNLPSVAPLLACLLAPAAFAADDGVAFFEKKIRPLLAEH